MSNKILDPHLWTLETLFQSMYYVPVYQRPYSWEDEQIDMLLKDIFEAYQSENKEEGYYIGNIIIYDKNEKVDGHIKKYSIIDGQQRITSFSLILMAIYSLANIYNLEKEFIIGEIKKALWKSNFREQKKEYRTVELNSIDKKTFDDIYNYCFENAKNISEFCKRYECTSKFDKRIIDNFINIYNTIKEYIEKNKDYKDKILDFAHFILYYMQFIVIEATCKEQEVFSMFESINSKGKKLDTIDLIKTYIFSKLDEESYNEYLNKWGKLIIKTHDRLYDYLYTFIRAYMCFYKQSINLINFKSLAKRELLEFYNEIDEAKALKKFLDDLYDKVEYYNMLYSVDLANNIVKSSRFRFYYYIFIINGYEQPKPLFFRSLIEYQEGIIKNKEELIDIIVEISSFMIKFLTISDRDSKSAITLFSNIMNYTHINGIDRDFIIGNIEDILISNNMYTENLKQSLVTLDCYSKRSNVAVPLLAIVESFDKNRNKISYDQAYYLAISYGKVFSLDHLLVQTPKKDDKNYKYYKDENDNLVLKQNHDFPTNLVNNGMEYEKFKQVILNRIGNLRLYYKDQNSARHNDGITLLELKDFYNYKDIENRGNEIADIVFKYGLPNIEYNVEKVNQLKRENKIFKSIGVKELLEEGILKSGEELIINVRPENSKAMLVDEKTVIYNNEKMTLINWGRKVTGWKSINIYRYVSALKDGTTLNQKREEYANIKKINK